MNLDGAKLFVTQLYFAVLFYFKSLLVCKCAASLCNISDVSITTKSEETEVASTSEFDCSGNILSSTPSHLPQGN